MNNSVKFGVIGSSLEHSLAPIFHNIFFDTYSLEGHFEKLQLTEDEFDSKDLHELLGGYKGAYISRPFKERIIKYLDDVSEEVKSVGSVNTINRINGMLIGYNTDIVGFKELLKVHNIKIRGKTFVILGSGGTAKCIVYAIKALAKEVIVVSLDNTQIDGARTITYEDLPFIRGDILVNTTPVGMFPNVNESIVSKNIIENYSYIVDTVYNPMFTKFLQLGVKAKVKCISGLYMLVCQGVEAQGYWQGIKVESMVRRLCSSMLVETKKREHGNIYITGMMGCGKTELGKALAKKMKKEFIDLDDYITKLAKKDADELFKEDVEKFRQIETKAVQKIAFMKDKIVALGSGAVLDEYNLLTLRLSGIILMRDRSLEKILATFEPRKNVKSKDDLIKLYNERYPLYVHLSDYIIPYGDLDLDVKKIMEIFNEKDNDN